MLFEITPVPAVTNQRTGSLDGLATCRVDLIEPADNAFGAEHPASVRSLRKRAATDGSVRSKPPEELMVTTAEAVVTRALLATLPDAALLAFRWGFTPGSSARDQD